MSGGRIEVLAPDGIGEVAAGTDLVALLVDAFPDLADGDVVVVTSKIVSKAEGRTTPGVAGRLLISSLRSELSFKQQDSSV